MSEIRSCDVNESLATGTFTYFMPKDTELPIKLYNNNRWYKAQIKYNDEIITTIDPKSSYILEEK